MSKRYQTEKPDNRRPQLWTGYRTDPAMGICGQRLRILYPGGKCEFVYTGNFARPARGGGWIQQWEEPCWVPRDKRGDAIKKLSFDRRVRAMKQYDKKGGRRTHFLGNL